MSGHTTKHKENLDRLARIEGQVRGLRRMLSDEEYCIDIITQIQAVQSALGAVGRKILEKHLTHCVSDSMKTQSQEEVDEKIQELMTVMKRMCK